MNKKAFSLVEVLIAIVFFAIGFGTLFFMFGSSNKQVFVARKDLIAYSIARERLSWLEELDYSDIADLGSYDLFSSKMLKDGYFYRSMNDKEIKFEYPKEYKGFGITCSYDDLGELLLVKVNVDYRLKPDEDTREVHLERMIKK